MAKGQFFAAQDGLGAAGGSQLVEGAGAVGLDGVFGDEELRGDLAVAHAVGDQGEDFELACGDAEGLLSGSIGSEGFGCLHGDRDFSDDDRFADGFATACDAEAEPDAEGGEEDGDERAVELDGVLDDEEAVFGVLEDGDEEAADETEDEGVALHGVQELTMQAENQRACSVDHITARQDQGLCRFAGQRVGAGGCSGMREWVVTI